MPDPDLVARILAHPRAETVLRSIVCDPDVPIALRHGLLDVLAGMQGEGKVDQREWMASILEGKP